MSQRPKSEIDISTPGRAPEMGWLGGSIVWLAFLGLVALLYLFDVTVWGTLLGVVALVIIPTVGVFLWTLIVKRGFFTWGRLALAPARLMARGDAAKAEAACTQAIARAKRFAPNDHRRGLMLCELAMFVKHQGRYPEAIALFEEAVEILVQHAGPHPIDYFIGLNNYSICFIHLRDFAAAQRVLERAIDLTLAVKKREATIVSAAPMQQVQAVQFVLHLNLAFLLIEMGELSEADAQLRDADSLLPLLSRQTLRLYGNHHATLSALWAYEAGHFADAEAEVAKAKNVNYPGLLRIRANLQRLRGEFAEAERLLRLHQTEERKKGILHRPEMLKPMLDLADCLFGQSKHADAFAAVAEACSLVVDFGLPMDAYWRGAAQSWLDRARVHGNEVLAAGLAKELQRAPAPANQAITIVDKFRRQAPG